MKSMNKITDIQISTCYKYAKSVYSKGLTLEQANNAISEETGMTSASAEMYIQVFNKMMEGKVYKRTINAAATKYYLDQISLEYGYDYLRKAISAVEQHIDSYKKSPPRKIQDIVKKYICKIPDQDTDNETRELHFQLEVNKRLADTQRSRKSRLEEAPKIPRFDMVLTKIFDRNPDVVAETLNRAQGMCERCKKPSPFFRATDNTPYLEVHHVHQLSKGGEDSVKNAMAVCPNCHRELHFGVKQAK